MDWVNKCSSDKQGQYGLQTLSEHHHVQRDTSNKNIMDVDFLGKINWSHQVWIREKESDAVA